MESACYGSVRGHSNVLDASYLYHLLYHNVYSGVSGKDVATKRQRSSGCIVGCFATTGLVYLLGT